MAYMVAQWVVDGVRDSFRDRPDAARAEIPQVVRVRAWLRSLGLDAPLQASIDEPLAALEDGLRSTGGDGAPRSPGEAQGRTRPSG